MAKYIYPAIFTAEENGLYSIHFPDLDSCYTSGDNLQDGYEMAGDVLCMTLYEMEENKQTVPNPSDPMTHKLKEGEFVALVSCDTIEYRLFNDNKSVKKTLTIPSWLNSMAEREGVSFSGVLQKALKQELNIDKV